MKPLLFLDVDGVFNAFHAERPLPLGLYEEWVTVKSPRWKQLRVTLDRAHAPMLHRLQEAFELVWATAWEHNANGKLRRLLYLPQLPVVTFTAMPVEKIGKGLHWKTERLITYAAGRPFCWIDDEPTRNDQIHLSAAGLPALILGTDPAWGLQERHVHLALDFAAHPQAPQGSPDAVLGPLQAA